MDDDEPGTLTLTETARRMGVHRSTVHRWVDRGDLPTISIGGRRRICLSQLRANVTPVFEQLSDLDDDD